MRLQTGMVCGVDLVFHFDHVPEEHGEVHAGLSIKGEGVKVNLEMG
jgi:hypothetical protein